VDLDQGLFAERGQDYGLDDAADAAAFGCEPSSGDRIIDVEAEDIEPIPCRPVARLPRIGDRFNTETRVHGQSLSQLAVHSLWIADYLRQLGETEMADGDIDSISHCADDLESAIVMMFQLAGGTRLELRQRYQELKVAMRAQMLATIDLGRR
jgi:hypothetical protein